MISITTHNLLIGAQFGRCAGPWLLWVILQNHGQGGQPIYYDKLMLECEEKTWKRVTSYQVLFQQGHRKVVQLCCLNTFTPKQVIYAVVCVAMYMTSKMLYAVDFFKFALASSFLIYFTAVMLLSCGITTNYLATIAMLAITCSSNVIYSRSWIWQPCYHYLLQQLRMYSP